MSQDSVTLERELLEKLRELPELKPCCIYAAPGWYGDGIVILSGRQSRGHWRVLDGKFEWTPSGSNQPRHLVNTLEDALRDTIRLLGIGGKQAAGATRAA
ncbi:MAG: hypothetical protein AB7K67_01870 [Hyphomicrobiaceae bacterium]